MGVRVEWSPADSISSISTVVGDLPEDSKGFRARISQVPAVGSQALIFSEMCLQSDASYSSPHANFISMASGLCPKPCPCFGSLPKPCTCNLSSLLGFGSRCLSGLVVFRGCFQLSFAVGELDKSSTLHFVRLFFLCLGDSGFPTSLFSWPLTLSGTRDKLEVRSS